MWHPAAGGSAAIDSVCCAVALFLLGSRFRARVRQRSPGFHCAEKRPEGRPLHKQRRDKRAATLKSEERIKTHKRRRPEGLRWDTIQEGIACRG